MIQSLIAFFAALTALASSALGFLVTLFVSIMLVISIIGGVLGVWFMYKAIRHFLPILKALAEEVRPS